MGRVRAHVRIARTSLSESIALYVCERLYDARIAAEIDQFRQHGGTLNSLEARVRKVSEEFTPELNHYVQFARGHIAKSLSAAIEQVLGKRLALETGVPTLDGFGQDPAHAGRLVGSLGQGFTNAVGVAVSAAVAAVLGTVSGGFGKALGMAIIVSLLHTSGPIAFVIGGISGLLMTAGAWYFGREKITGMIKEVNIPGTVVRMVLWESRLDRIKADGRAQTYSLVQKQVDDLLQPLDEKIADEIWRRIGQLTEGFHHH